MLKIFSIFDFYFKTFKFFYQKMTIVIFVIVIFENAVTKVTIHNLIIP